MLKIPNEKGPVLAFKVSPDEKILVLGGYEHVLIKEPQTGNNIGPGRISLPGSGDITAINFCPKGKLLIIGGHDGRTIIFDASSNYVELSVPSTRIGQVMCCIFCPDATKFAISGADNIVNV